MTRAVGLPVPHHARTQNRVIERQEQACIEAAERTLDERDEMTRQAAQEAREKLERSPDNDRGK